MPPPTLVLALDADTSRNTALIAHTAQELAGRGRQRGYVRPEAWQARLAHLAALGCAPPELAALRASLARAAVAEGWVFPDEPPPGDDMAGCRDLLVGKVRLQAGRAPVITEAYLSTLMRLAAAWGLEHEALAQEIALRCVAERWPADWELACGMEGLLGAEQARLRRGSARERALARFERRGQKGWLTRRDLLDLYTGLGEAGLSGAEVCALMDDLHAAADARGWAWSGGWSQSRPAEGRLDLLVGKAARQAAEKRRISRGFRDALLVEAAAAEVDQARLLAAIVARQERERWPAGFEPGWGLPRRWWRRLLARLDDPASAGPVRRLTASGVRVAAPLVVVSALVSVSGPLPAAPPRPLASPAAALATATPVPVATVAPRATAVPPPASAQPLTLVVAHTGGVGARLRTAPATGPVARLLGEGTAVVEIGSKLEIDGTDWRQVRAPDGTPGWMAADLLQPADSGPGEAG
jgi:hypothetical protein